MSPVLLGVLAYVAVQLAIGLVVSRRIRTESDYLLAGRRLGLGLTTFTVFATWFGAESLIGAAGSVYASGLSGASAEPFGYGLCLLLMGAVFAVPLWRRGLTTLGDLFRLRFGPSVERLAVLLLVPTSMLWAAAQVRAFGQVLSAASGLGLTATIVLAAAVVLAYTTVGGLLADAWTDLVQGIALIVGLVVLAVAVLGQVGWDALAALPPERLRPLGAGEVPLLVLLERWAVPVLGSVVAAELVQRVIAARSPDVARNATVAAGALYLLVGLIPVAMGLLGPTLVPGLDHPEQVLPRLAEHVLPLALNVVFAGALVSAILSTVDSALLVAAALLSHNLVLPLIGGATERAKLRIARLCVVGLGLVATVLALRADGVSALVAEASAFGSAGIFVAVTFGLFTRWGGPAAGAGALVSGMISWVIGAYVLQLETPYLASLATALSAYAAIALLPTASVRR